MKPGASWVERGSDGQPYFVRKKQKLPSTSDFLNEVLGSQRRSSFPFSRAFRRDFHILPASVSTSHTLPTRESSPPPEIALLNNASQQSQLSIMYPYPPQLAPMHESTNQGQCGQDQGLRQPPQRFAAPHPRMYPIPPPPLDPFTTQPLLYNVPQQFLPPGARFISPPRFPTTNDLKYKCSICGRFRSPRYHYKHPIPPGELPKKTVCRRCREAATDSEDDDDDSEYRRRRRHRQERSLTRSRSRTPVRIVAAPSRRSGARSSSRVEILPRGRPRSRITYSRRYTSRSRSSSRETRQLHISFAKDRPRRPRSPSVELVRYIEDRPPPRPLEEVFYADNRRRHRSSSFWDDPYYASDEAHEYPRRTRIVSRAPTPMPRTIHRQYSDPCSDPYLSGPITVVRRELYDGPTSVVEERSLVRPSRPVSRASSRDVRIVSAPERRPRILREVSHSDEDYDQSVPPQKRVSHEDDWYDKELTRRGRSHRRSRSSLGHLESEDNSFASAHRPYFGRGSPPPAVPSSLSYLAPHRHDEEVEVARTREHDALARRGRPMTTTRRRRSGSRSVADAQPASTFLRPGDEVTVIERNREAPAQDYDWYDKDGMKVRVREI